MPYIGPDYFRREMLIDFLSIHDVSPGTVFWQARIRQTANM
jgi:hypothetical protein